MQSYHLISAENIYYVRQPRLAIRNLSFSLKRGEVLSLVGANGTGKTTTLELLAGLIRPDKGRVIVQGIDLALAPLQARPSLGFVPDQAPLYPEFTVREYLLFIAKLHKISKELHPEIISETMRSLQLTPVENVLIGLLSKGQKQRVAIAQAILPEPQVLLLDEPTQGLDRKQVDALLSLLQEYKKKSAIVLSAHSTIPLEELSDYTLHFNAEGIEQYASHRCTA